nr:hypothetical protein [Tanacetum cinerariifolium]
MNSDQSTTESTPLDVILPVSSEPPTSGTAASGSEAPAPAVPQETTEPTETPEPMLAHEAGPAVPIPVVSAPDVTSTPAATTESQPISAVEPVAAEVPATPIIAAIATPEPVVPKPTTTNVIASGSPIVLPNGKVGESYSFRFTPDVVDLSTCTSVRVLGPEGLGLTFNQETQTLAGQPAQAGEYELKLSYQPADAKSDSPTHVRTLRWYVNPDPRSLWTEHEPPADLPARKEHAAHLVITQGPKTLVAASNRGRSHAKDAKFREDDFRCYYQPESNCYVLAVADGAGSASMSREGSRLACETATEHLLTQLKGETGPKISQLAVEFGATTSPEMRKALQDELYKLLGNAALLAARQITKVAEAAGHVVRDYATTLLLAICQPTAHGWLVGAFWIGDGGLGLYRRQDGIKLLGEPDGGEYSGQTRFLTMKDTFEGSTLYGRIRFELVPDFDALVLMTDGITDALFQTDANLTKPEKWAELLEGRIRRPHARHFILSAMANVITLTAHDGSQVEYVDTIIGQGGMKDVYFSPDKSYVVCFFRTKADAATRDRLLTIAATYRERIFNQAGGDFWQNLFCWPTKVVEHDGRLGIVTPTYQPQFFFKVGSRNSDFLAIKGKEKEGKWFASAFHQSKNLDQQEKGDFYKYLQICLNISRAVRRMHAAGLAHSDLSYKNVLIDPTSGKAAIIDIDGLVVPGKYPPDVIGTPDFIAPEVLATLSLDYHDKGRRFPNIATDRHALAVMIYMYLLRRHPLRGRKVNDADPTRDEELSMGANALFVEHPTDKSNRPNPADMKPSYLPWGDVSKVPYTVCGPYLTKLFDRAFTVGLKTPSERPTADDWETALIKTVDLLQPCPNPACEQKWYVFDNTTVPKCPYCGTAYVGPLPMLNL